MLSTSGFPEVTDHAQGAQGWENLLRLVERVPALQTHDQVKEMHKESEQFFDYSAVVTIGARQWHLVAEFLGESQPRHVRQYALSLRNQLARSRQRNTYGVLLAPYLSEESASLCSDLGVGYVDLSGNCLLQFDHVYIERRTGKNALPERRSSRSVFAPKAGRILRQMLTPPLRTWKVKDLHRAAGVSLGYVSKVSQALEEREWMVRESDGIRLKDPQQVLRSWEQYYEIDLKNRERYYTLLQGARLEEAVKSVFRTENRMEKRHTVLASFSAARYLSPFGRQNTTYFYADAEGREALLRHLALKLVRSGENIVIDLPAENDIIENALNPVADIWTTGLVQTYLDLCAAGERGQEAGEHLMNEQLVPGWRSR